MFIGFAVLFPSVHGFHSSVSGEILEARGVHIKDDVNAGIAKASVAFDRLRIDYEQTTTGVM